jgi:hypothetical protein
MHRDKEEQDASRLHAQFIQDRNETGGNSKSLFTLLRLKNSSPTSDNDNKFIKYRQNSKETHRAVSVKGSHKDPNMCQSSKSLQLAIPSALKRRSIVNQDVASGTAILLHIQHLAL